MSNSTVLGISDAAKVGQFWATALGRQLADGLTSN
jgi:hypothetical protein